LRIPILCLSITLPLYSLPTDQKSKLDQNIMKLYENKNCIHGIDDKFNYTEKINKIDECIDLLEKIEYMILPRIQILKRKKYEVNREERKIRD